MNQRARLSMLVIQVLIISLIAALFGRLFYLQVAASGKYKDAALSIQSRDIVNPAARGLILDSSGVPLALNRIGLAVLADRNVLDKQSDKGVNILARTAKILGMPYRDVFRITRLCGEVPTANQIGCWTGTRYQPIPITKDANPSKALQIVERSDLFKGIDAMPLSVRSYPGLELVNAAHLLGYVGPLTQEDLSSDIGGNYFRGESIGKTGLEYQYDSYLRGIAGIRTVIVDRKESVTQEAKNTKPISGDHLVTSVDIRLQSSVESALTDAVMGARSIGYRADGGAAVVMDVRTGRILALASYPTYNPNIWEKGLTIKQSKDLFSEATGVPALSRPLQGLYAPASTFKVISLAAAANAGYNLDASYNCPSQVTVGDRDFKNFESRAQGRLTMQKAMAISCDTIWYQIAYDEWVRDGGLRPNSKANDYFFAAARGFQVAQKTGIDLPSESSGRVPDRQWKSAWYKENKDYFCNYQTRAPKKQQTVFLITLAKENCLDGNMIRGGDAVNFSIGQGDTVLTPLKMAQMYAAIANGGKIWQPTVARAVVKTNGIIVKEITPKVLGRLPASARTLKFLRSTLREVIVAGTAAGTFAGFPIEVSGKTGTAEVFGLNANGQKKDNTSWFASFAPSKDPKYAVVVMVSQGGFGASTSAVGVRKIYDSLFGIVGSKVVPGTELFPQGPPQGVPLISPATRVKGK